MRQNDKDVEHGKRGRSCSPTTNDNSDAHKHAEKKLKIDAPQFYNKINEMFPKFDEILKGHIEFITNDTLKTTEEKMESIFNEIQTLNGIIRSKEAEWNRLIHLKMIKEEIYTRLTRKRHALQFEAEGNAKSQNKLSELKDLELYLSDKQSTVLPTNSSNSSIQQIIEKRANMKPEDLQRESNGTSRLHSLLVSHKVLPSSDTSEFTFCNNGKISLTCKNACLNTSQESYKHHGYRTLLMKGRQEDSTVMKSNMEDSRQKTPDISPREIYSTSLQKKEIQFGKERNFPYCAQHFTVEDLAMTPITAAKKKDINLVFNNLLHRSNNISFKHSNSTVNSKGELELSSPKFTKLSSPKLTQYPFCQHCKIHESRFVCAGCGNQWYCSRTCQISAWDKHSEICTD